LLETDVPHVFLVSSLDGSAGLPHINFTTFTRDAIETSNLQTWFVLDRSK
jgi:hypothetical protein